MSMSRKERRKSGDELAKKYLDLGRTTEFFQVLECIPRNPTQAEMDRVVRHHLDGDNVSLAFIDAKDHKCHVDTLTANRILEAYLGSGDVGGTQLVCNILLGRDLTTDEFRQLSQNIS